MRTPKERLIVRLAIQLGTKLLRMKQSKKRSQKKAARTRNGVKR